MYKNVDEKAAALMQALADAQATIEPEKPAPKKSAPRAKPKKAATKKAA
jgi:hypothetical protein